MKTWFTKRLLPLWLAVVRAPRLKRTAQRLPVAVKSPGVKKVLAEHVPVLAAARSGVQVVTFAAQPRDHSQKLNKKMYRAALRCILSELTRQERLLVVENFELDAPKTKSLVQKMAQFDLSEALIVTEDINENLFLASRNLHKVDVRDVQGVDPVALIRFDKVIVTVDALKKFEEILG